MSLRLFLRVLQENLLLALCVGSISFLATTPLSAQLSTIIERPPVVRGVVADEALAKADTGRMIPGYQDMSRYTTPGLCYEAMTSAERLWWRTGNADTVEYLSPTDTILTSARKIGRNCIASMTPQTVLPVELFNLLRVAARVGDTALVRNVVAHQLSLAHDTMAQGFVLLDAVHQLLKARPIQDKLAETFVAQLESLGVGAAPIMVLAKSQLQNVAYQRFDTTTWLRLSREKEAIMTTIPPEIRKEWKFRLGGVFSDSIAIVQIQQIPNLLETVDRLVEQATSEAPPDIRENIRTAQMNQLSLIGTPFLELSGIAWYPDEMTSQSLLGKVTLVVNDRALKGNEIVNGFGAMIHRLYERYHDRGFQIIVVLGTQGFVSASPILTAAEEAKARGWMLREYIGYPYTVVIQERAKRRIFDGRRVFDLKTFEAQYQGKLDRVGAILVGRDGKIMNPSFDGLPEAWMDAWIRLALGVSAK